jgi:hypothetical protein
MGLRRSAEGTRLLRRRHVECMSCGTFISMVETPMRTEVVAGRA